MLTFFQFRDICDNDGVTKQNKYMKREWFMRNVTGKKT